MHWLAILVYRSHDGRYTLRINSWTAAAYLIRRVACWWFDYVIPSTRLPTLALVRALLVKNVCYKNVIYGTTVIYGGPEGTSLHTFFNYLKKCWHAGKNGMWLCIHCQFASMHNYRGLGVGELYKILESKRRQVIKPLPLPTILFNNHPRVTHARLYATRRKKCW